MSNYWTDNTKYKAYAAELGNPFLAVKKIAAEGRQLAESTDNVIFHSEGLVWATTSEEPSILKSRHREHISSTATWSKADEVLAAVNDDEIVWSVRQSLRSSENARHLIYVYHSNILDEFKKARVRVLTKMAWYSRP